MFLDCLHYNRVKQLQMANYLSAIKTTFLIHVLDVACFAEARLKYYQGAVQLHAHLSVKLKKVIDIPLIKSIIEQCDYTYMGQIFKCVFLWSFYSFLRMSNLVPHSMPKFSTLKHLARGDVIFKANNVVLLLKCSKTMQTKNVIKLIYVPKIPHSSTCPVVPIAPFFSTNWARNGFL